MLEVEILILDTNSSNHGPIRSTFSPKIFSSFQLTNSKFKNSDISFHWYMAIVYNPKALLPQSPSVSDSDSIKSVAAMEYDSIDSCSSTNGESKRAHLILSSDDIVGIRSSGKPQAVENIAPFDGKNFFDSIKMEEKYLAVKDR